MRLKELRGLPVIDPTAARKIGTVIDYQVDPVSGRIAALAAPRGSDCRVEPGLRIPLIQPAPAVRVATAAAIAATVAGKCRSHRACSDR